jgi:hypothetical protein
MRTHVFVIALIALACGLSAQAQQIKGTGGIRYRWVDAKGLPHYSDSLTDNAIKAGYDVLDNQGMVVQHVHKQLTPQERAAAQKLAEQQAARRRVADQQRRDDIQLLNTYPDEAAYKAAQQQALDNLDQQINTTRINLHSQEKALTDLLARAADIENDKKPVPKFLTDRIAKQRDVVAEQRATLARQQDDRDTLVKQQAQQLQHFRDLKAQQKEDRGY